MTWGAIGGAAVGVVGGLIGGNSASSAAKTQSRAADAASQRSLQAAQEANALQAAMYKQGLASSTPYTQGGQVALAQLMAGLGLGPARSSYNVFGNNMAPTGDVGGQGGPAGGYSGGAGMYVNEQGQPVDAQGNVITDLGAQFGGIGNLNVGASQEELDAAAAGIAPGSLTKQFTAQDFLAGQDPGYQFRVDQGNAALAAKRASVGNRSGGQALKDIANYNQDLASQEYGNAFNRFQTNQQNIYNRLSNLAGLGQTQTNTNIQAGQGAAGQIGSNLMGATAQSNDYLTGGAAARAAGQVGSTNAIVGGAMQGLGNYYLGNIMNGRKSTQPYTPSWSPSTAPAVDYGFGGAKLGGGG